MAPGRSPSRTAQQVLVAGVSGLGEGQGWKRRLVWVGLDSVSPQVEHAQRDTMRARERGLCVRGRRRRYLQEEGDARGR